ncbi:MAG: hypothetical protein R3F30_04480 [Planctomycetota bacterium]
MIYGYDSRTVGEQGLREMREVTLRSWNGIKNEDEDGKANVGDGRTNYFIYPTGEGEDASWLRGMDFVSEELVLRPHGH